MTRKNVNAPDVAASAGITPGRWRHIVNGAQPLGGGQYHPVVAPAATLARMALAVGVTPEQLEEVGRADAAKVLREDLTDTAAAGDRSYFHPELGEIVHEQDVQLWEATTFDEDTRVGFIFQARAKRMREETEHEPGRRAAG